MLPLYVGALALGGTLIVLSIVLGATSHDVDHALDGGGDLDAGDLDGGGDLDAGDLDAGDLDAGDLDGSGDLHGGGDLHGAGDLHGDHALVHAGAFGGWQLFLSMRFWTFGFASFGLAGLLGTLLRLPPSLVLGTALVLGVGIGWASAWLFARVSGHSVSAETRLDRLAGVEAVVLLPVRPEGRGKVRLTWGGQVVDLPARTGDGRAIAPHERVLVVAVKDGVADVTRLPAGEEPGRDGA